MTLKELMAKNEAIRKAREEKKNQLEKKEEQPKAPKKNNKGRKPKTRMYLVNEELPFEEEVDTIQVQNEDGSFESIEEEKNEEE